MNELWSEYFRLLLSALKITSRYAILYNDRYQFKISNAVPNPSQKLIQAPITAMALSVKAIVAIVALFVALPSAVMIIWTLIKPINIARLRCRGMTTFFESS